MLEDTYTIMELLVHVTWSGDRVGMGRVVVSPAVCSVSFVVGATLNHLPNLHFLLPWVDCSFFL